MPAPQIIVKPLGASMGAEVSGVDLSEKLSDQTFSEIYQAFVDHLAIFLPKQQLSAPQLSAFVSRFGEPLPHPYLKPLDGAWRSSLWCNIVLKLQAGGQDW